MNELIRKKNIHTEKGTEKHVFEMDLKYIPNKRFRNLEKSQPD